MGKPSANSASGAPPAGDQANAVVTGVFAATGQSPIFSFLGWFNVTIYGDAGPNGNYSGTVELEKSFDGGTTWQVASLAQAGTQAIWNTANKDVATSFFEPERSVLYRLNCTAYVSGNINYRLSQTGQLATSNSSPF